VNRQAQQAMIILQSLGKMTERVLSNPARTDWCATVPIFKHSYDSTIKPSLLNVWQSFDPAKWTVDCLKGAVYQRNVLTPEEGKAEWEVSQLPDDANFKAAVICVMRTIKKQPAIKTIKPLPYRDLPEDYITKAQVAELIGSNIGDLVVAFTGCVLSCKELLEFETME